MMEDKLVFMSADTGKVLFSEKLQSNFDKLMLISLKESKSQFIISLKKEIH